VPSGLTALIVATVPLWMTMLEWLVYRGSRPTPLMFTGLALGLVGVLVLIDPRDILGTPIHLPSLMLILIACLSWSIGSLYSRRAAMPRSVMLATGMEMLGGGVLLLIAGSARGEWMNVHMAAISWKSIGAYAYLVVFGSLVGFSAYIWLLKHVSASAVSTYAYVNPLVAVLLGWWLAHEPLSVRTMLAAGLIIAAVVLITTRRSRGAVRGQSNVQANIASASGRRAVPNPSTLSAECREPALCGCDDDR
jgi:drug/metabolite transporter (DMT)-like permease